mgnify:CR=1 FL=1
MKLKVVFHLQKNEHSWTGKMDSPDQGAKNIPIEKVEVKNDSIFISDSRIAMNFKGKIVNNFKSYIATVLKSEKALEAEVGDKVTLRLSNSND